MAKILRSNAPAADDAATRAVSGAMSGSPAGAPPDEGPAEGPDGIARHPAWAGLKAAVEAVRRWQRPDGSVDFHVDGAPDARRAARAVDEVVAGVEALAPLLPHNADYHRALVADLRRWARDGFGVPDFIDSLLAFRPAAHRRDGLEHLVVFPMYTQNGNPHRNLEAVALRVVWPDWIAELERTRYDNPMFVPIAFQDFTPGYATDSAVLFPETVSVRRAPERFTWGAIFCDREAARFRRVSRAAAAALGLELPQDAADLLEDQRLAQQAFVLWDMIHDRAHSHGELPFDPFMIKQRQPFWMYGLEELRCDLTAFQEAAALEAEGVRRGRDVQYAIVFDRLFRFPVTGGRVRNYDGLGGQLLFAYLHRHQAVSWRDSTLHIDWDLVPTTTGRLRAEIEKLYRDGVDRPKLVHWLAGYDLVAGCLSPHPGSVWAKGTDALDLSLPPRALVDAVLPDEFPLSMFYEALRRKLGGVIASTRGITSGDGTAAA